MPMEMVNKIYRKLFKSTSPATDKYYRSVNKVPNLYWQVKSILSFKTDEVLKNN